MLGIIYAPQKRILYISRELKAYKIEEFDWEEDFSVDFLLADSNLIQKPIEGFFLRILKSRARMNKKTERFLEEFRDYQSGSLKEFMDESPLRLCGIAEGKYDYYPHLKPVREWEIAPFDALITASGNMVTQKDGILPLQYNSPRLKFPAFIAKGNFQFDSIDMTD